MNQQSTIVVNGARVACPCGTNVFRGGPTLFTCITCGDTTEVKPKPPQSPNEFVAPELLKAMKEQRRRVAEKLGGICGESTEGGDNIETLVNLVEQEVERLRDQIAEEREIYANLEITKNMFVKSLADKTVQLQIIEEQRKDATEAAVRSHRKGQADGLRQAAEAVKHMSHEDGVGMGSSRMEKFILEMAAAMEKKA